MSFKPFLALTALALTSQAHAAVEITPFNLDMSGSPTFTNFFFAQPSDDGNLSIETNFTTDVAPYNDVFEVIHFHDPLSPDDGGSPDGYSMQSFLTYQDFTWDPVTDGEIVDVSYSVDVYTGGSDIEVFFTIDDINGGNAFGFTTVFASDAGDYTTVTFNDVTEPPSRDFVNGPELFFGFGLITTSFDDQGDQFSAFFDNFTVTIETIPAPGSTALLASAGLVAIRRRRN